MTDIEIAEQRIKECEERRTEFAEKFFSTGKEIYKRMAESETDMIQDISREITKALLQK